MRPYVNLGINDVSYKPIYSEKAIQMHKDISYMKDISYLLPGRPCPNTPIHICSCLTTFRFSGDPAVILTVRLFENEVKPIFT